VAITKDAQVLAESTLTIKKNHSLTLMPMIDELTKSVGVAPNDFDRFVVAQGPGSYTGLRIGVTTAKTLAYTLHKELVGVSSLKAIAANAYDHKGLIVPIMDARRKNVYAGLYQTVDGKLTELKPDKHIAFAELLHELSEEANILFLGDTKNFAKDIAAANIDATVNPYPNLDIPNATRLAVLGENDIPVQDIHGFLPHYLKRVEAEEKWLEKIGHPEGLAKEDENYVEKI
jgi:tRNA threonylcarbamoyl adenosine modification protein YeaZ